MTDTEQVLTEYIACALWYSYDDQGIPLDAHRPDFAPETLASMREDVVSFLRDNADDCKAWQHAGFSVGLDFWLTRNGHGVGFWDRASDTLQARRGNRLTEASKPYGECDLYFGDDGLLYLERG